MCYAKKKQQGASPEELKNHVRVMSYQCEQCRVSLCVTPCFKLLHTVEKYHLWDFTDVEPESSALPRDNLQLFSLMTVKNIIIMCQNISMRSPS